MRHGQTLDGTVSDSRIVQKGEVTLWRLKEHEHNIYGHREIGERMSVVNQPNALRFFYCPARRGSMRLWFYKTFTK